MGSARMRHRIVSQLKKWILPGVLSLASFGVSVSAADNSLNLAIENQMIFNAATNLPATATLVVEQCLDGYVWFGGYGGLSRYDGRKITTYDGGKLANIDALLCDHEGTLWIGSSNQGLISWNGNQFHYYIEDESEVVLDEVRCLGMNTEGRVYFGTEHGVGYLDDDGVPTLLDIPSTPRKMVTDLAFDSQDHMLCVTEKGKLYEIQDSSCSAVPLPDGMNARSIEYIDETGLFYVGTDSNALVALNSDMEVAGNWLIDDFSNINHVAIDHAGNLVLAGDDGIALMKEDQIQKQDLMLSNSVEDILVDSEGNYWFCSSRLGVLLVRRGAFKNLSSALGLKETVVNAQIVSQDTLYIGHDEGLEVIDMDGSLLKDDPLRELLGNARVRDLYEDREGNLWVCTGGRGVVCRKKEGTLKVFSQEEYPEIPSNKFRYIYETKDSILAACDGGVVMIRDDQVENLLEAPDEISCRVLSMCEFQDCMVVGTDGYGIYVVKDRKVVDHFNGVGKITFGSVMKLHPDEDGAGLWMITGNGLYHVDADLDIHKVGSLPVSNVLDCFYCEDMFYVVAGNGIYATDSKKLKSDEENAVFVKYDYTEGLPFDPTPNSRSYITEDEVFLCGNKGCILFQPNEVNADRILGEPHVDHIILDGESTYICGKDHYDVPSRVKRIEFDLNMVVYSLAKPDIRYRLDGFDSAVQTCTYEEFVPIQYTGLRGGNYNLHLELVNPTTGDVIRVMDFGIDKETSLWERKGFMLAMLLLVALMTFVLGIFLHKLLADMRKRKLEQRELTYKDPLTSIYNRRFFEENRKEWEGITALMMIDLDMFKNLNDRLGHLAGDEGLRIAARVLCDTLGSDGMIIRYGGDEFLAVVRNMEPDAVKSCADEIRCKMLEYRSKDYPDMKLSVSMGLLFTKSCRDQDIAKADELLYEAKKHRNVVVEGNR